MLKLWLSYFGHLLRRQDSLEKTIRLGKAESSRKRGRPNTRWIDSLQETTGLIFTRAEQSSFQQAILEIHMVTMSWKQLDGM